MKNVSARVDVVMASPEQVHPPMRIILIATTKGLGIQRARQLGIEPVAIVTPRAPHAAYGIVADDVIECPDLTPEQSAELQRHVRPSLATTIGGLIE